MGTRRVEEALQHAERYLATKFATQDSTNSTPASADLAPELESSSNTLLPVDSTRGSKISTGQAEESWQSELFGTLVAICASMATIRSSLTSAERARLEVPLLTVTQTALPALTTRQLAAVLDWHVTQGTVE